MLIRFITILFLSVAASIADTPSIGNMEQWAALIPKEEHSLKSLISGEIDGEYVVVYKSSDARVAVCIHSPKAENMTAITYDIVDKAGRSLFVSAEMRKKNISPLTRVFTREDADGKTESTITFGVLEPLQKTDKSPIRLKLAVKGIVMFFLLEGL